MEVDFQIRRLDLYDEILKVLRLYDDRFDPGISEKVESLEDYAKKLYTYGITYCIDREDEIVGFVSFYSNEKEAYITLIATDSRVRRCKLGTRLLAIVSEYCKENTIDQIRLEVDDHNDTAIKFYESQGFIKLSKSTETTTYYIKSL